MNYKLSLLMWSILNNWILFLRKLPSLIFGLFLFSVGIVANLNSNLGMSPWGVLNVGITNHTYFSLGQVTQIIGIIVLLIGWGLGFPPGFGTLMNMYFIGFFIDVIMRERLIPQPNDFFRQVILLGFSVLILGVGSLFYLSPKLGAGPRDGLMMGLVQKYNRTVGEIRTIIEITVLIIGYLLGGPIGIGTLISALTVGYAIQLAFHLGRYDKMASHMNLYTLFSFLKES